MVLSWYHIYELLSDSPFSFTSQQLSSFRNPVPQFLSPHIRLPTQSSLLSQLPIPTSHGLSGVQQLLLLDAPSPHSWLTIFSVRIKKQKMKRKFSQPTEDLFDDKYKYPYQSITWLTGFCKVINQGSFFCRTFTLTTTALLP